MKALLFGSIGVVVDSSRLQLQAYNAAFDDEGLGWHWSPEEYRGLLARVTGGRARLEHYAGARGGRAPGGAVLDRVHATKTRLFDEWLFEGRAGPRPGVRRLLEEATAAGVRTGFVTSTELGNVRATLEAAGDGVRLERFDVFTHRGSVAAVKPHPAPWRKALEELGLEPGDAVAIEDTAECTASAVDAGLVCVATPNSFSGDQDFSRATAVVDCLGDLESCARQIAGVGIVEDGLVTLERLGSLLAR